jgi:NAD(P)-dependent dehydrogenase (short-subunit alcohol dehydrogenase family)
MHSTFYDVAMTAQNRLAFAMAEDLRPLGIGAISLSPGFVKTELVDATYDGDRSLLESVEYTGRAVVALAADPAVLEKSGRTLLVGELARQYGFTDVDGRQPPPFAVA